LENSSRVFQTRISKPAGLTRKNFNVQRIAEFATGERAGEPDDLRMSAALLERAESGNGSTAPHE